MPGFGDFGFDTFDFGDEAQEDPFGIHAAAVQTQWWKPARKKKESTVGGGVGYGWQGGMSRKTDSVYPNMGPDPSTTQRAILDAKQKQEDAARIFNGEAPRDPAAGGGDFDLGGGGVLKYQAPDPTNPGHQDAARERMDISLQDYNDYFADKEAIKKLEDDAYALPNRTGFWGSIDRKRDALLQRAEVLRRRNAERRASNPSAFGMQGPQQEVKTVGNLVYDPSIPRVGGGRGDYVYPDAEKIKAMHKASGGTTQAPHLETLIEPRTGNTVRVDQAAVPRNAQGQLVERYFQRDPKLQGPTQPGVDSLGETKEELYGVPDTAAETAAASRERIAREKSEKKGNDALTAGNRIAVSAQKRQVDAEINKQIVEARKSEPGARKTPASIAAAVAELEKERQRQYDRIDADTAPPGAAPKPKAGAVGGVKWRKVG
jgi:hypothetical protein